MSPKTAELLSAPKSAALFEEEQGYIAPGIQSIALLSKLSIEKGRGARLTDADGNTYLDFNVGVYVCSLGYSHPKYKAALKAQIGFHRGKFHLPRPAGIGQTDRFA